LGGLGGRRMVGGGKEGVEGVRWHWRKRIWQAWAK